MVHGIETDRKKLSKVKKSDEKWFTDDLQDIKRTVEHYIDEVRPANGKDEDYIVKSPKSNVIRYAIMLLGIFGLIVLITGIYLSLKENSTLGIPVILIGGTFFLALVLSEVYRT
jgi:hypothetical protein